MAKAAGFFVGDQEITALLAQYREKANQVDEVLARMAALAQQNRWCEVSQILAELQQTGVSIKGVDLYATAAQQRFGALQPLVATARAQLQQGHTAEAVANANRALQHVADHAEALEIVESSRRRHVRGRRLRRLVGGLITVGCAAAIAAGAYLYFAESTVVTNARRQLDKHQYGDVSRTLTDLPHRWFVDREATYLQTIADLKKYASAKAIDDNTLLQSATRNLKELFSASEAWREQAKLDLADTVAQVPPDADDTLARGLRIASALNKLKAGEHKVLAEALLKNADDRHEFRSPASDAVPADYVKQILEWDSTKARMVVGLALPKEGSPQQGLRAIRGWAETRPTLAGALRDAVLQVADEYVATGRCEEAKAFVDTAKHLDSRLDTWDYWERQFQKVDSKNPQSAIAILTFMVEGEYRKSRLRKAADRFTELRTRYPSVEIKLPPEIDDIVVADQFRALITDAEQLVKSGQYQDARRRLAEARRQFSSRWEGDPDASRLDTDVRFQIDLEEAHHSFEKSDLDIALTKVNDALQSRPENKEAADLRDTILAAVDKTQSAQQRATDTAAFEQHRQTAESAVTAENPRDAVDEILKAYRILEKPLNATWSTSRRVVLDKLAKTLIEKLFEQATERSDKRQYEEAKEKVRLGLQLRSQDERLSQLLKEIEQREADPKTVNVTGTWLSQGGAQYQLIDDGTDTIAFKALQLPPNIQRCVGVWKRKNGDELEGKLQVIFTNYPGQNTEGVVNATIKGPKTLDVHWADATKPTRQQNGTWSWQGKGLGAWTKQEGSTDISATQGNAEGPVVRPPSPMSTQDNPFAPRPTTHKRKY
jgi:hypothetical protein